MPGMADYDFPDDLLDARRRLDTTDRELVRLHAEYADQPGDEDYRARVAVLRETARAAVREIYAHPWPAAAEGGAAAARMALQQHIAAELAAEATPTGA